MADAVIAADRGIDAIMLSNHGGRQLDDSPAILDLVAPVADAVGDRVEIMCDGGVRRGSDIVKALALGATACTIGRAYLYGLAAGGEAGVDKVIGLLGDDIRRTMALIGESSLGGLTPDVLQARDDGAHRTELHRFDRRDAIIGLIVRRFRSLLLLVLGVLALSACQLDVKVDVAMNADGTGEVVVVATVDADVVSQMPGLEGSLVLDDATSAGWVVEGPTATEGGGLTVTLRHPFASAAEAAVLVNSLGPPFQGIALDRVATEDEITTTLTGALVLANGFDGFGDANLVTAAGATPFRAQLDAAGATPAGQHVGRAHAHDAGRDRRRRRRRRRRSLDGAARRVDA